VIALLVVPAFFLHTADRTALDEDPVRVLNTYLRASYARDYSEAYRHISARDRRLKTEAMYVRERGAFGGFTLEIARKLAESIEITPLDRQITSEKATLKARLKVPDANKLSDIVMDWNFEQLNSLPASRQKAILDNIEKLGNDGKLPMVEGEEDFQLVREAGRWKMFLDWASGVRVMFKASLPPGTSVEANVAQTDVITKPGELFNISLQIRNRGQEEVLARIGHLIQPKDMADYLDLVECGFLLPVRIKPGATEEFSSTYLLRGGLPENVRQLAVTYEFKVEK
ncbi:MAG: cytochrome c oxidase assembly protein, partial [Candidatus Binatia bacterium]